ncbi:MATE family efflux transporter [Clostridium paraputrificum]|uniref:MATE family efflux transporter n=1 Tax=Clostridium TaxID=1485 RepID=UPI000C07A0D9|nr:MULTISPECIES: MATE family efflux transporter [Clostridium]MBS7130293.1 MATE family efflux transporter [Clostridium sp.]MDB2075511.1 MATE family efflux transporter [Clostridium paraputrificum]MDB2078999.1 MATE family efflux transporter [Clostridium paraputrificum]MDB2084233.1 MATE family efflux transporter [Clostridium paraputrificum]MDB2099010.1 MATE family efflux transporter [Clostridium paraputrificum]
MRGQARLGEEKISKLLMEFSIPAIIGMVVNTLYNIVDRMYIGNIKDIGGLALTGVGITMPIMTIIMAFGMLIGIGTSARISLKLGEHKREEAEKHLGNAFTLIIIASVLITIIGLVFMHKILGLFGASADTEVYAREYMQIIFFGTIFNMLSFGLNHSIRSDGSPKVAMLSMLIGAGTNIILDPIFIFVFGMGVRGAAIATVISQIVSTIWILYYFTKGKSNLKIKREYLSLDKAIVLSIFSIGVSPFSMQIAQSIVQVLANNALKTYGGDLAIGAMTIINSVAMIFMMPIFGLNQGSQPIIGYNYGAEKYKRVKQAVKSATIVATIIVSIGWIITQAAPHLLISIFNRDEQLVGIASTGMRIFLFMLPVVGAQVISSNYFQSIGKAKISMFLSLLRQVILLIPCLIILPKIFGLTGVWLAGAVSDGLSSLITLIIFFMSVRKLKDKEEIVEKEAVI